MLLGRRERRLSSVSGRRQRRLMSPGSATALLFLASFKKPLAMTSRPHRRVFYSALF